MWTVVNIALAVVFIIALIFCFAAILFTVNTLFPDHESEKKENNKKK